MTIICTAKKCEYNNIISGDTFLICWLCDNCAHVKCAGAGFNGRIGDLISKKVGFTWSCTACREMTDEMRTFMRQTRTGFMEVRKLLTSMNDKFLAVESQFLGLKILSESPKRKIPNNLQLPANGLTTTMLSTPTGANIMEHSPIYLTPSLPPAHTTPSGSSDNLPMQSHSALAAASPGNIPPEQNLATPGLQLVPDVSVSASCAVSTINDLPSPRRLAPGRSNIPLSGVPSRTDQRKSVGTPAVSGIPLSGVIQKSIFVSRLNPEATAEDVKIYLCDKLLAPDNAISVYKFNFKQKRNISSFKILLTDHLFPKALDSTIWPVNTLVHEYLQKDKTRGSSSAASKN
ncbi:uncharacterized protein [Drosophila takahashii]|uniref:uncharacterized protein n=1 Tax=Drosophila takahashii TaxID=29030 RepID=UPI00389900E6